MDAEEDLLEEGQPLRLHLLALFEDDRHVLHVLGVVRVDLVQRRFVLFARPLYLLLGLLHALLQLPHLFTFNKKNAKSSREKPSDHRCWASFSPCGKDLRNGRRSFSERR